MADELQCCTVDDALVRYYSVVERVSPVKDPILSFI